jgi:DNA-nicking Smr family endonuclease
MNLSELWIGDPVWIRSKAVKGIFEGIVDENKAKIKAQGAYFIVDAFDISLFHEKAITEEPEDHHLNQVKKTKEWSSFETTLDLHTEKLELSEADLISSQILDIQIRRCRSFIKKAIELKISRIIIIHGKGKGILKEEIQHLVSEFPEVSFTFPVHQEGGLEVLLNYYKF